MRERVTGSVSVVASAGVHVLLLAVGMSEVRSARPAASAVHPDTWAARSVEVGTVSDSPRPAAPAPAEPARAPQGSTAKPNERAVTQSKPEPKEAASDMPRRTRPLTEAAAPRVAAASPRQPTAASPVLAPSGAPAASTREPSPDAGSFGALGLPPGIRHLGTAFTRALPAGAYMDREWSRLPLGSVGGAELTLEVDESGTLQDLDIDSRELAPVIERMLRRAALLLRTGRFSLDPKKLSAGTEHLKLAVTISERRVPADESANPDDLFGQSSESPTQDRPGYAQFTLNSGRHVRVDVRRVPPGE